MKVERERLHFLVFLDELTKDLSQNCDLITHYINWVQFQENTNFTSYDGSKIMYSHVLNSSGSTIVVEGSTQLL